MKNRTGQILLHITGCIAFLSLPVLLSPDVSWNFRFIQLAPFQADFLSYTLILLFFYLHYFFLLPDLYFRKKYIYYLLAVVTSYAIIAFMPDGLIPGAYPHILPPAKDPFTGNNFPGPGRRLPHFPSIPRLVHLFQFLIVLILSALIRINNRLRQAEKEKVNAELSYLKAQINPHFLFNTLNSIYALALQENADGTAGAVVKLSGMMRYVISEAHHDYVSLAKEIGYIADYIELQKLRLGNTVQVIYRVNGNPNGLTIAPLLLISFIENAFKHGVNPEQDCGITIEIDINAGMLQLLVSNAKVSTVHKEKGENNIGLENTRNRLQLLYPSRHELMIKENETAFTVMLTINMQ